MMEHDLFALAKLPFDFDKKDSKEHENAAKAIDKQIKQIGTDLQYAVDRALLEAQRDFLLKHLSPDKKSLQDIAEYERLKEKKLNDVKKAFEETVKNLKKQTVTEEYADSFSKKWGLSKQSIIDILENFGFKIVKFVMKRPEFPSQMTDIENELGALLAFGDNNPSHSDLKQIREVYSFVAYIDGRPDDATEYSSKAHNELKSILDAYSAKYSGHQPSPRDICVRLAKLASVRLFDSRESQDKYNNYLAYNSPKMKGIIARIKGLPEATLKLPDIADGIIREIEQVFTDKNEALSIYNFEAKLTKDPYIPQTVAFYVKCGHCGVDSAFDTQQEANAAQNCRNCSKALYKQCRKCSEKVLVVLDKCAKCGFVFAGAAEFTKHFSRADEARRKGEFESARQHLAKALEADPAEKARVSDLERKISADEAIYKKPVNDLRKLTTEKRYQAASEALVQTINAFPMLNVSSFETEIKSALSRAQTTFDSAKNCNPSERADICLDILNYCADFKPALQLLQASQPQAVKGLTISVDRSKCVIMLNWEHSHEKGITYKVVRKIGKDIPKNERDGEVLKDNLADALYRDENIVPGVYYGYAIFAKRMGIHSVPVGNRVLLLADVTNINYEQNGNNLRMTWNLPKNSTGVTISRKQDGQEIVLTQNAQSSFEDKGLEYGKTYSYIFKANYLDLPSSDGDGFFVTFMREIDQFQIHAGHVKDNKYRIGWKIDHPDIDLRILADKKVVREIRSDKKDCEIELPKNGFHQVDVEAFSGGKWLISQNSLEINTYTSCEIDKNLTQISERLIESSSGNSYSVEFNIKVSEPVPNNAVAFWCVVRTKSEPSKPAPWASAEDIATANDAFRVTVDTYRKREGLIYTTTAKHEDAYYITMFTVYDVGGKEVVSAPFRRKFERPVEARLFWKVAKPFLGNPKLSVEIRANRFIYRRPKLVLCCCPQNAYLSSYNDPRAVMVMELAELELEKPQKDITWDFEVSSSIPKNSKLFLFESDPKQNENYSLSWASGFKGRI